MSVQLPRNWYAKRIQLKIWQKTNIIAWRAESRWCLEFFKWSFLEKCPKNVTFLWIKSSTGQMNRLLVPQQWNSTLNPILNQELAGKNWKSISELRQASCFPVFSFMYENFQILSSCWYLTCTMSWYSCRAVVSLVTSSHKVVLIPSLSSNRAVCWAPPPANCWPIRESERAWRKMTCCESKFPCGHWSQYLLNNLIRGLKTDCRTSSSFNNAVRESSATYF